MRGTTRTDCFYIDFSNKQIGLASVHLFGDLKQFQNLKERFKFQRIFLF